MNTVRSPYILTKRMEADVTRLLSGIDTATLSISDQSQLLELKNTLVDARLDAQDYELAETREHQLRNATDAKRRLAIVQEHISANTLQMFGPVDVAHLTAQISQITDLIK